MTFRTNKSPNVQPFSFFAQFVQYNSQEETYNHAIVTVLSSTQHFNTSIFLVLFCWDEVRS